MPAKRNRPKRDCFNQRANLPFQLRLEDFELAMQDVYDLFYDVNTGLLEKGLERLDDFVRPAIMSGLLSDLLTASIAKHSRTLTQNNYFNGHPDLLVKGVYPNDSVKAGSEGVEIQPKQEVRKISFPEEADAKKEEARRLADRAVKRASEGNYEKAIGIYKRVLELQPSFHSARRDLAMAYVEVGDVESATNHLIEVLRLDPKDAWSWVVLANLYIREKSDKDTGEKFLRKALEIAPNDAWALNSLAAVCHERGKTDEAIKLFEQAIAANPEFANAYYGEAIAFDSAQKPDAALETLNRMFAKAKMQDARSKPVYDGARQLFAKLQVDLAERNQSEAFKLVQNYKAEMESLSGFPIRIQEENFESKIGATIQMAWKHNRDFHLVKIRADYPPVSQPFREPRTHSPQARI